MKDLKGTEKQVKWAEDIRAKLIEETNNEIEKFQVRYEKLPKSISLKKHVDRIPEYREKLETILETKDNASWWIDHRDDGFYSLIRY